MKCLIALIVLFNTLHVKCVPKTANIEEEYETKSLIRSQDDDDADEYLIGVKSEDDTDETASEESDNPNEGDNKKKPCAIMVLSHSQSPTVQSLIRRYRYDQKGLLIPSSVKYFIKMPQPNSPPVYVPLNDKAFSPLGGFVKYYKEVPPIPQAW